MIKLINLVELIENLRDEHDWYCSVEKFKDRKLWRYIHGYFCLLRNQMDYISYEEIQDGIKLAIKSFDDIKDISAFIYDLNHKINRIYIRGIYKLFI